MSASRTVAAKTQLAQALLLRAFEPGLRPSWVTGDEVYGRDSEVEAAGIEAAQADLVPTRATGCPPGFPSKKGVAFRPGESRAVHWIWFFFGPCGPINTPGSGCPVRFGGAPEPSPVLRSTSCSR